MTRQQASTRRYHIRAVMAWGYSMTEALRLCKCNDWFGDKRAI